MTELSLVSPRVERRLMAVLAADVAGYSRLVGADEEGTLAQWKAHWRELIAPKIAEHRGRIVRIAGDGLVLEVARAGAAVRVLSRFSALWWNATTTCRKSGGSSSESVSMSATSS